MKPDLEAIRERVEADYRIGDSGFHDGYAARRDTVSLLAYVEKLERVAEAAKARIAVWTRETYIALHDALAALEADDE
jgi:hypothetical protein